MYFYLDLEQLLLAWAILLLGAVLQGTVGFGLGLLATPILLLLEPRLVPGPFLLVFGLFSLFAWRRERAAVRLKEVQWAVLGRLPGTGAAMAVLTVIPRADTEPLIGAIILVGVAMSLGRLRLLPTPRNLLAAGFLSGFMGTTAAVGGPPVAMVYQEQPGPKLRGTLAAFFVFGTLLSLGGLALVDRFGADDLTTGLALLPGPLAGYFCSPPLARRLDRQWVKPAVLLISTLSGLTVLAQHWLH